MIIVTKSISILSFRYIEIRSQDPQDRDHKGIKTKNNNRNKPIHPEEQQCFIKEE